MNMLTQKLWKELCETVSPVSVIEVVRAHYGQQFPVTDFKAGSAGFLRWSWPVCSNLCYRSWKDETGSPRPCRKRALVLLYVHKIAHNSNKNCIQAWCSSCFLGTQQAVEALCPYLFTKSQAFVQKEAHQASSALHGGCRLRNAVELWQVYIGYTGRYINNHLRDHVLSINNGVGSHLPSIVLCVAAHHCLEKCMW